MFRILARATQPLRHPPPFTLPAPASLLTSHVPAQQATPCTISTATALNRNTLAANFMRVRFVGPLTAHGLVAHGCRSYRDALELDGKRGSGVTLNVRQRWEMEEEASSEERQREPEER